jgi:hypothetical protein
MRGPVWTVRSAGASRVLVAVALAFIAAGGCYLSAAGLACDATHACPDSLVCDDTQHCALGTLPGSADAGRGTDAGSPNTGSPDSGSPDAGAPCDSATSMNCPDDEICSLSNQCLAPRYNESNGVVSDTVTGLQWQQVVPSNPCPSDPAGTCTWPDATTYCMGLSLGDFATGWRVPHLAELFSLVDTGAAPTIDSNVFPNTPGLGFWTADCFPNSSCGDVYDVEFGSGEAEFNISPTSDDYVRCVH